MTNETSSAAFKKSADDVFMYCIFIQKNAWKFFGLVYYCQKVLTLLMRKYIIVLHRYKKYTSMGNVDMKRFLSKWSDVRETVFLAAGIAVYCMIVYFLKMPCPIYFFSGISCPGCGMTRALFSLLRFDFDAALYYHPLIYFCIFMLLALMILHIRKN